MTDLAFRLATRADLPAAAALHIESCLETYRGFVPKETLAVTLPENLGRLWKAETLGGGDFIVLAELYGALAGIATVRNREPAYIDHFHVRPTMKGRGVGRRLWRAVVAEMRARGKKAAYLDFAEGNDAARAFYRAMEGEIGEAVEGDLFGTPIKARAVHWPNLAALG